MKHKKAVVVFTIVFFCSCGVLITSARHHSVPGVDKPYDPVNYYSTTSISWPDSAPSTFTLRDIAQQGGEVHDSKDIEQDNISNLKTTIEAAKRYTELYYDILNLTSNNVNKIMNNITGQIDQAKSIDTFYKNIDIDMLDKVMYNPRNANFLSGNLKTEADKYNYINGMQEEIIDYIKNDNNTLNDRQKALNDAIERLNNAQGQLESMQTTAEINSLLLMEQKRKNEILALRNILVAAQLKAEQDETIRNYEISKEVTTLDIQDPYHQTDYEKSVYERPKGVGWVDFK